MKELIVIAGPTASGKTTLSVELAKTLNTVVVSADSRQFYKEMNIGTAKPSNEEIQNISHYFIDSHSIKDPISSSQFAEQASALLDTLFLKHNQIILTGGSGMFIDALCYGLDEIPHDKQIQTELNDEFQTNGLTNLLEELKQIDLHYYNKVDKLNPVRIIRALEVCRITGKPYSTLRTGKKKQNKYTVHYFVIDIPRPELYNRINKRVDLMIENGLEKEAQTLIDHKNLKPLATVGYTEWFDFFDGKITRERCIDLIKQNSRRYAKRQITWFKRNKDAIWISFDTTEIMQQKILSLIS